MNKKQKNRIPEFGIKRENEERRDGGCAIVFDPETKLFAVGKDNIRINHLRFFGGGVGKEEKDYDHWFYFLEKAVERIEELGFN